jgi:hypothetical protein
MAEPGWVGAHLFHQGDLDGLLVAAVHPLVGALAADGLAAGWFYLRHWEGGLHVRLRVRPRSAAAAAEVRDRVVAGCRPYLAAHPSEHRITPAEYAGSAAKLARLEGANRYESAQREPDAVAFLPYERERARYGRATTAMERHQQESSRLALDLLRSRPEPAQRDTAALALLLLAWFAAEPEPARLAPRVAADAVPPDPVGGSPALWRAAVDRRYRGQRDRLAGLAGRMRAVAADPRTPDRPGLFAAWTGSVRAVRDAGTGPATGPPGAADPLVLLDR